jgi:hypothetical protein
MARRTAASRVMGSNSANLPSGMEVPLDLERVRRAPGFEVPEIEGTVEGWRAWVVDSKIPPYGLPPKLRSVTWNYAWYPGQISEARCHYCENGADEHKPADKGCSCGFYSAKTIKHLMEMGYHGYHDYDQSSLTKVIGRVANWGQVTEGTQGWRSQYSYPVMVFVPYEHAALAEPIQKAFGCKVRLLNFLKMPGEVNQLAAVAGEMPSIQRDKARAGLRCKHRQMAFKGHVAGDEFDRDGELWVPVRWDARPESKVNMRLANIEIERNKF